jgi:hypothetical protein
MTYSGWLGFVDIEGATAEIIPLLRAAAVLQAGERTSAGHGRLVLERRA